MNDTRPRDERAARLTLRDLAGSLGVSKTTVSNAFSRPDQLSPELRDRILEAARAAGYAGPHPIARMLKTRRAGAIGLILPASLPMALDDDVANELLRGIADACEERRLGLLVVPGVAQAADPRTITDVAVDGFVAFSLPKDAPGLAAVLERRLPLVIVDQPRLPGTDRVGIDDRAGARAVTEHLVGLGHRRFAIASLPIRDDGYNGPASAARLATATYDVPTERIAGYRDALAAAGIDADAVPIHECAHSTEELGRQAADALLALDPRPTAILGMTDRLAMGAMVAARARGLDLPGDLSVVGFDDLPGAAHVRPALTTVRQPLRLKGYAAARLLLDGAEGGAEGAAAGGFLDLRAELVIRRSSGPVPAR